MHYMTLIPRRVGIALFIGLLLATSGVRCGDTFYDGMTAHPAGSHGR